MKQLSLLSLLCLAILQTAFAQKVTSVPAFDKVIISPHVEATFKQGKKDQVNVLSNTESDNKVHIESNGNTLRVYLEGAKEVTRNEKSKEDGVTRKESIYKGTVLTIEVIYTNLKELSVRGEETIRLSSKLAQEEFNLTLYGEPKVYLDEVELKKMHTTMYGESNLELKSGTINEQGFTIYGEGHVNTLNIDNKISRTTLYGEADLRPNTTDLIKVTAFGEAKVGYKGNPEIRKGINIGKVNIYKLD